MKKYLFSLFILFSLSTMQAQWTIDVTGLFSHQFAYSDKSVDFDLGGSEIRLASPNLLKNKKTIKLQVGISGAYFSGEGERNPEPHGINGQQRLKGSNRFHNESVFIQYEKSLSNHLDWQTSINFAGETQIIKLYDQYRQAGQWLDGSSYSKYKYRTQRLGLNTGIIYQFSQKLGFRATVGYSYRRSPGAFYHESKNLNPFGSVHIFSEDLSSGPRVSFGAGFSLLL